MTLDQDGNPIQSMLDSYPGAQTSPVGDAVGADQQAQADAAQDAAQDANDGSSSAGGSIPQQLYQYLTSQGVGPNAALGYVSSHMGESGKNLDPNAIGDNGSSLGFAQWHADRADGLKAYAAANGLAWNDPQAQVGYYIQEHTSGPYAANIDKLKADDSIANGVRTGVFDYEKPADKAGQFNVRLNIANNLANNGGVDSITSSPGANPALAYAGNSSMGGSALGAIQNALNGGGSPDSPGAGDLLSNFAQNGPAGLFGMGSSGLGGGGDMQSMGRGLALAGLALSARDNPSAWGAYASLMNSPIGGRGVNLEKAGVSPDGTTATYIDPRSGRPIQVSLGVAKKIEPKVVSQSPDGQWITIIDPTTGNLKTISRPQPQGGYNGQGGNPSAIGTGTMPPNAMPAAPAAMPDPNAAYAYADQLQDAKQDGTAAPMAPNGVPSAINPNAALAYADQLQDAKQDGANGGQSGNTGQSGPPKVDLSQPAPQFSPVPEDGSAAGMPSNNPFARVVKTSPQAAARFNQQIADATQGMNRASNALDQLGKAQTIIQSGNYNPSYIGQAVATAKNYFNIPDQGALDLKNVKTAFATLNTIAASANQKGQGTDASRKMITDEFTPLGAEYSATTSAGVVARGSAFLANEYQTQSKKAADAFLANPQFNTQVPGQPPGVRYSDYYTAKAQAYQQQAQQSAQSADEFTKRQIAGVNAPAQTPDGSNQPQMGGASSPSVPAPGTQAAANTAPRISNAADYGNLPAGAQYIDARTGQLKRKAGPVALDNSNPSLPDGP